LDVDRSKVFPGERSDVSDRLGCGSIQVLQIQDHGVPRQLGQVGSTPPELPEDSLVVPMDAGEPRDQQGHGRDDDPRPVEELGLNDDDQHDTGSKGSDPVDDDASLPATRRDRIAFALHLEPMADHAALRERE
jgi:hypothetical protein